MYKIAYCSIVIALCAAICVAEETKDAPELKKAFIDGNGEGWRPLWKEDFTNVNTDEDTWDFRDDGVIACKGTPIGVLRTNKKIANFELVVEWRHLTSGGNSGVFVWIQDEALKNLPKNKLPPGGIEVQVLDHGYTEQYEKSSGKKADWFTSNGDVFPVGTSDMKPFPPVAPDGKRSFPSKNLSLGVNEWNHYYVRGVNGEIRLWVNGEEVSGGSDCDPSRGFIALESEGAPVEFKNLRIRELP